MNSLAKIILTVIPALKISKAFRLKLLFIKFLKVFIKDFLGPIKIHQNPIGLLLWVMITIRMKLDKLLGTFRNNWFH